MTEGYVTREVVGASDVWNRSGYLEPPASSLEKFLDYILLPPLSNFRVDPT